MRILSGIQPSGALHLGNYFGMMKPVFVCTRQCRRSRARPCALPAIIL
jgi:tryptophanyl-tRNA synthetase